MASLRWLIRLGMGLRLLRQRYVYSGGQVVEPPLSISLATGVAWQ